MRDITKIYDQMTETVQAFSPYYREGMMRHAQENEAPDNWFPLNFVRASEPEPFRLAQAEERAPYVALSLQRERYKALAAAGCLEALGGDSYRLTDKGRRIVEGFFKMAHEELAEVEVLPADEMNHLAELLQGIVTRTVECPEPAEKPSLLSSRWTDPGPSAAAQARIDQYSTDLMRYRNDARLAAWHSSGVDGKTWETLTLLWREEASTAAEVAERLSNRRGYDEADYSEALETLAEIRWITANGDGYHVTDEGKKVRQAAEEYTNGFLYQGWAALSQNELDTLDDLLTRLNSRLREGTLRQCWAQARALAQAIFPITRKAVAGEFEKYFDSPRAFFPTLMAFGAQPDPLTTADYGRRFPYTKPERTQEILGVAEASGCLVRDNDNFSITSRGKEAIVQVNDVFYRALADLDPLPEAESAELVGLLAKVVEAALESAEPKEKWSTRNIHNCHPETEYGPLAKIDQLLDDLNGFRDDVHIAAWQPLGVSGRDWDALTLVWRDVAHSAADIAQQFEAKGYSADEYDQSLRSLVERGWLAESAEGFRVTDKGNQIRQDAEEVTDLLFFGPWQELDDGQLIRLHTLLTRMKVGLQTLAEEADDQDNGA